MSHSEEVKAIDFSNSSNANNVRSQSFKRELKPKENIFKLKCNKELKKKLKKYKLRRDGNEDPEILNVSESLVKSLRIKSPNSKNSIQGCGSVNDSKILKPNNYLFKMIRKRKNCAEVNTLCISNLAHTNDTYAKDSSSNLLEKEVENKTQMDAFKLMMDSRNKIIGSNSLGKEKCYDEIDLQEIKEKKELRTRRLLTLQKIAEDKGALNKKKIEEDRDRCVKKRMLKRAERLKSMINKPDLRIDIKDENSLVNSLSENEKEDPKTDRSSPRVSTFKLYDVLTDTTISKNMEAKKLTDEDFDFLNKLSPSLRKQENMLCYYQKINKKQEISIEVDDHIEENTTNIFENENKSVIKVKFTTKKRKKNVENSTEQSLLGERNGGKNMNDLMVKNIDYNDSKKRKRNVATKEPSDNIEQNNKDSISINSRPQRNTKMPVKYTEDVHCFSSEEELHIFTPKKKKNKKLNDDCKNIESRENENLINNKSTNENNKCDKSKKMAMKGKINKKIIANKHSKPKILKKQIIDNKDKEKKPIKLAPIFVTRPQVSHEAIEAKQIFLKSGVPDMLKKKRTTLTSPLEVSDTFYSVVHIQQLCNTYLSNVHKDLFKDTYNENNDTMNINNDVRLKHFLKLSPAETIQVPLLIPKLKSDKILKQIKSIYPKFPVYRTYHLLKGKSEGEFKDCNYPDLDNSVDIINNFNDLGRETPEKLCWSEKYKPSSSKQFIGNFDSIKEIKKWLESWTERIIRAKNNSDLSDTSDFYCSDTDSTDTHRNANSVLIITGQSGCGKTSAVYAVAAELAIKVIEVNASSKRNSKIMLQDLQEATRSHKVNRGKVLECSQKSQEESVGNFKKRGRPKKSDGKNSKTPETLTPLSSQDGIRTGMSLILIDDADIIFDQDEGFCSAISQLIQSSKRPVILVTSSLSCLHLKKFLQYGKIIKMHPFLPRMLGTWLDLMCLADVGTCFTGLGSKLLDFNRGDIRKSINCLQFFMNSVKVNVQDDFVLSQTKCITDDESSIVSWAESEGPEGTTQEISISESVVDKQSQLLCCPSDSIDIFNLWWNLSCYFIKPLTNTSFDPRKDVEPATIKNMADVLDIISIVDHINNFEPDRRSNIACTPWYTNETASLLELEDCREYSKAFFINKDITDVLLTSTISKVQNNFVSVNKINIHPPSMGMQRERDKKVSRHQTLSSYLNPSAVLDRRAAALDYWPSCRTLCRLEKSKTDANVKRNNRFCHYLKSINVLCKNDFFDSLADSLT